MPIYFKLSMQKLPLTIDSIGNHWSQESVSRPKGFPLYHWLQTEKGQGTLTLTGTESDPGTLTSTGTESGLGTLTSTGTESGLGTLTSTGTESGLGTLTSTGTESDLGTLTSTGTESHLGTLTGRKNSRKAPIYTERKIILNKDEGILLSPFTPHHYQKTGGMWLTTFLTFGGTLTNDIQKICGDSPYLLVNAKEGVYFQEWINQTLRSYLENSLDDLSLSVRCYEFLMHFSNIYTNHSQIKHPLYQQYVWPVIVKIETEYAKNLNVDTLALTVHISPQYLARLFRRFTGYSVQNYINRFRINKAKEFLIGKPYLKVQSISHQCGYNDASYFISVFRQQTGTTPKQFRKIYGISNN